MDFDYNSIIDKLYFNQVAYRTCVQYLFPFFKYKVITEHEVRTVDMKEFFAKEKVRLANSFQSQHGGTFECYFHLLGLYLNQKINCKKGSQAERYKKRANELIKSSARTPNEQFVYDTLMILLSLFRAYGSFVSISPSFVISGITPDIYISDLELLKTIHDEEELLPEKIIEKQDVIDKVFGFTKMEVQSTVDFFYTTSVLFLCWMLLNRGLFEEGE